MNRMPKAKDNSIQELEFYAAINMLPADERFKGYAVTCYEIDNLRTCACKSCGSKEFNLAEGSTMVIKCVNCNWIANRYVDD